MKNKPELLGKMDNSANILKILETISQSITEVNEQMDYIASASKEQSLSANDDIDDQSGSNYSKIQA